MGIAQGALLGLSGVRVRRDGNHSWAGSAVTPIPWQAADVDTHGYWQPGSPAVITIPQGRAGLYLVQVSLSQFNWGPGAGSGVVRLRRNAVDVYRWSSSTKDPGPNFSAVVPLQEGDLLDVTATSNDGGTVVVPAWLAAVRMGGE